MTARPPVLLTVGQFYGTLAAVRCLGRAGVPVTLAEGHALAPARWSRYVTRRVRCPDVADTDAFLSFLHEFGASWPGHVLLAASDDVAWLIAQNRETLSRWYRLVPTEISAIDALLDKRALLGHSEAVGLDVPETWFPASEQEAVAIGAEVGAPLLLKPRSQVLLDSHSKGILIEDIADIGPKYRAFMAENHHGGRVRRSAPDIDHPMLQRYYPEAREHIYGLSGYAGERGEIVAVRAARKILQRPRKLGIGLCFEEAEVVEARLSGIARLCERVGYRGMFEVELCEVGGRALVIDFNPRLYSQLAFDVDRGMALPRIAYADALADRAAVEALCAEAAAWRAPRPRVYCHRFLFEVMLRAQRLSGHLDAADAQRWRHWLADHRRDVTDAVADPGDAAPLAVDVAAHLTAFARHPRSFVRRMVLDG